MDDIKILEYTRELLKKGFVEVERSVKDGTDYRFECKVGTIAMCEEILTEELGFTRIDLDSNGWDADYFMYLEKDNISYYLNCNGFYGGVRFEENVIRFKAKG